jgi:hypothetical protein
LRFIKKEGLDEGKVFPYKEGKLDGNAEGRAQKWVLRIEIENIGGTGLEEAPANGGSPGLTGANNKEGTIILESYRLGFTQNIMFLEDVVESARRPGQAASARDCTVVSGLGLRCST